MMRKLACLLCLVALALAAGAARAEPGEPLVFFGDANLPPYEFLDKGKPKGATVDLAEAIGRTLDRPVEIRLMQWDAAQAEVEAGRGHALMLLARTPEREKRFDFTQETLPVNFSFFVRADSEEAFKQSGLAGKRIGVAKGSLPYEHLKANHPDAVLVLVEANLDGSRRLMRGDIDALGANTWSELYLLKELGITGIAPLPPFLERKSNIAVRKGDLATLAAIDGAITQLKNNGEFDKIIDRWSSARVHLLSDFAVRVLTLAGAVVVLALCLSCFVIFRLREQARTLRHEVAERRRVEAQLIDHRNRLDLALDTTKVGMYVWDLQDGKVAWTTHQFRILGYEPNSIVPTYEHFRSRIHPQDVQRVDRAIETAKQSHADFKLDYRVVWPDGSIRYISGRGRFLYDETGKAVRGIGGNADVTEATEAANALARSERQFSTLVENSPDIFARMDLSYRHLYVSPAIEQVANRSVRDFIGKTNAELGMPADLCAFWDAEMEAVVRSRQARRISFTFPAADGSTRFFDARLLPEFDLKGEVESLLVITSDVTERERMTRALQEREKQLCDADRRKDEFLATLAHELRNPLAPIRNAVQLMRLTGDLDMQRNAREIIERQVDHLVKLVDDLLDVNRINQGKLELRRQVFELSAAVHNAIETSQPLIDREGHTLSVRLPKEPIFVDADLTRLTQVIANLLNNAAKYTPPHGHIELAAMRADARVRVSVKDNGIGIAQDALPSIFEMFLQIDHVPERVHGGLGIGLALVKRLVELHGGTVAAYSKGPGQGAELVVDLPVADVASAGAATSAAPAEYAKPAKAVRILVVDDNIDNAESMAALLELLGYEVAMAHDGHAALAIAERSQPDVVFLDIGLPGMSGHEVARRIRALPKGREVFLVAVTGWGQAEDIQRSEEAGFNRHIVKPVNFAALREILQDAVPA